MVVDATRSLNEISSLEKPRKSAEARAREFLRHDFQMGPVNQPIKLKGKGFFSSNSDSDLLRLSRATKVLLLCRFSLLTFGSEKDPNDRSLLA